MWQYVSCVVHCFTFAPIGMLRAWIHKIHLHDIKFKVVFKVNHHAQVYTCSNVSTLSRHTHTTVTTLTQCANIQAVCVQRLFHLFSHTCALILICMSVHSTSFSQLLMSISADFPLCAPVCLPFWSPAWPHTLCKHEVAINIQSQLYTVLWVSAYIQLLFIITIHTVICVI